MPAISVQSLSRYFKVHKKEPGFKGSLKSLIKRKYNTVKAVDNITFNIESGELVGFIGPNGAGKTTTLKMLSGLLFPTSGNISVLGYTPFDRKNEFLKQISILMGQKGQLWMDLPPTETFLLLKEIFEVPDDKYKKTIDELIELLDLSSAINTQVRKLSLGQRMKCELIASLIHQPKVLFLDEPTIGLDVMMQHAVRKFIKEYNKKTSSTILLTSHYMEDVRELCDRIIIINYGKILYDGSFSSLIKNYARNKIINLELNKVIESKSLEKVGNLKFYKYPFATITVQYKESNKIATYLLDNFPIADLNIKEPDVDDIIREFFTGINNK